MRTKVMMLICFIVGGVVGTIITGMIISKDDNKANINNQNYTISTNIKFAEENKRDFIDRFAQFSIAPNGEIKSLKGRDAVLLIQHDKEDWDWYNAAFITDENILEKYETTYGEHRSTGFPAESIFDK